MAADGRVPADGRAWPKGWPRTAEARRAKALRMLADGYELLRHVKGGHLPVPGAEAIMGHPGPPYVGGYFISRATFDAWRERGYIERAAPYMTKGWQLWRITPPGVRAALTSTRQRSRVASCS